MFSDGYALAAAAYAAPTNRAAVALESRGDGSRIQRQPFRHVVRSADPRLSGRSFWTQRRHYFRLPVYGISSLAIVESHTLHQLIALRFISGIGLGGLPPNTIALNAEFAPKRARATMIVFMFMGITVGGICPAARHRLFAQVSVAGTLLHRRSFPHRRRARGVFLFARIDQVSRVAQFPQQGGKAGEEVAPGISIAPDAKFLIDEKPRTGFSIRLIFRTGAPG